MFAFVAAIVKPLLTLNTTLVKLGAAIAALQASFQHYEATNATSHSTILERICTYDSTLQNHNDRIIKVEASASAAHKRLDEQVAHQIGGN